MIQLNKNNNKKMIQINKNRLINYILMTKLTKWTKNNKYNNYMIYYNNIIKIS